MVCTATGFLRADWGVAFSGCDIDLDVLQPIWSFAFLTLLFYALLDYFIFSNYKSVSMKVTDSLENCMTETLKLKLDDEPVVGVGTYSKDAHFNTLKDAKKRPLVGKRMSRSIDAEKHVTNVHQ